GEGFAQSPDLSIDYAVMERSQRVAVVPADFTWSDVGSWSSYAQLTESDGDGNRLFVKEAVSVDSHSCHVHSPYRVTALLGVENLLVVDTPDALLIARRDRDQEVKEVVRQLKERQHDCVDTHVTVYRPWGSYTVLEEGPHFKIKRIVVKPKQWLSLQMHHHRSEHWIVVSGTAQVTVGTEERLVRTNESTFIPAGNRHRLGNPGVIDLHLIEVQSGDYLREDDIVRFEDIYGRAALAVSAEDRP
ncbi:MAG: cupin domain-containing protein, partial [Thiomonas sp.]